MAVHEDSHWYSRDHVWAGGGEGINGTSVTIPGRLMRWYLGYTKRNEGRMASKHGVKINSNGRGLLTDVHNKKRIGIRGLGPPTLPSTKTCDRPVETDYNVSL
jgi:hypothetical protein